MLFFLFGFHRTLERLKGEHSVKEPLAVKLCDLGSRLRILSSHVACVGKELRQAVANMLKS